MEGSSKGLRKGAWSAEEDSLLRQCIDKYGEGKWHKVSLRAGLNRCRKSCRLRWLNYLKPTIKKGKFSSEEVDLLIRLHKLLGNRWSLIAGRLPDRTANDVKNYWNTHLSKKHGSFNRTKMKNKNITSIPPPTTEVQRTEIVKPQPRFFCTNNSLPNSLPKGDVISPCFGLNNKDVSENSNNFQAAYNVTYEDNMLLESLVEDTQQTGVQEETEEKNSQLGPVATATNKEATLMFDDIEQLWSLFEKETVELN